METRTVNLKVTNHNDFEIEDRFDGVPYLFEPGVSVVVPPDAALHIFGWSPGMAFAGIEPYVQKRWGWNTPALVQDKKHREYFKALEFKTITYKMVEVVEETAIEDDDVLPPLPPKKGSAAGAGATA